MNTLTLHEAASLLNIHPVTLQSVPSPVKFPVPKLVKAGFLLKLT